LAVVVVVVMVVVVLVMVVVVVVVVVLVLVVVVVSTRSFQSKSLRWAGDIWAVSPARAFCTSVYLNAARTAHARHTYHRTRENEAAMKKGIE
jgi:hypothetical protein